MLKTLVLLTMLLASSLNIFAQANQIIVIPKKAVYTRKFLKANDPKRTFEVRYPIVKTANAAVKRKIGNTINYWRVFETSLKENLTDNTWLSSLDYQVNYNKNGIFDVTLIEEGSGAYPDTATVNLIVNLKTGERVKFADVFKTASKTKLAEMVNKKLAAEKREILKQIDADKDETKESKDSLKEQVSGLNFTDESFDEFKVSGKGVTILYDAGFAHAIQALQPNGEYFFSYSELKPFIKPGSLLEKFVR